MATRFIPNVIDHAEAIRIADELGCRVETVAETGEVRLSHPLIGRSVKLREQGTFVARQAISFLREIAGLPLPKKRV